MVRATSTSTRGRSRRVRSRDVGLKKDVYRLLFLFLIKEERIKGTRLFSTSATKISVMLTTANGRIQNNCNAVMH